MTDVQTWRLTGDWFDVCKCTIPCPCTFAQPPSEGDCEGVLAWHIREGRYGDVPLDGLNVVALGAFEGNIWAGETKVALGMFLDERAREDQREGLQTIFGGQAGGWPGEFASRSATSAGGYDPIEFGSPTTWLRGESRFRGRPCSRRGATGPTMRRVSECSFTAPGPRRSGAALPGLGQPPASRESRLQPGLAGRSRKHFPCRHDVEAVFHARPCRFRPAPATRVVVFTRG